MQSLPRPSSSLKHYLLTALLIVLPFGLMTVVRAQNLGPTLPTAAQEPDYGARDYVVPGELPPDAGKVISARPEKGVTAATSEGGTAASSIVQETIQYKSIVGVTYTLRAYSGKYVRWAFQDSDLDADGLSPDQIYELVHLTDINYAHMSELLGGEPSGSGLLTIALVDPGAGNAGLGWVGAKGLDIAPFMLNDIKTYLAVGQLHGVILHEMSHNFDIYSWPVSYINYYGDFSHTWTHFLQHYILFYASWGDLDKTPKASLAYETTRLTRVWDAAGNAATWSACVRNGAGCPGLGIAPNDGWSGFMLRFARLHGRAAMKKAFSYLKSYAGATPVTPEDKNDLLVKALAYGANANVLCEVDAWNWEVSAAARTAIAGLYPASNPMCTDADADGYSKATGDYNDSAAGVHPGATEVQNGVDDDCNDVVDDLSFTEPAAGDFASPLGVSATGRITGRITTGDSDNFNLNVTQPRKVIFELCSDPDFQGWLFMYKSDGSWFDYQWVPAGGCSPKTYQLNEVRQWRFEIALNTSSLPGKYSLRYYTPDTWPAGWGTTAPVSANGSAYRFSVTTNSLANTNATPTHVRFWVDGYGFVGTAPYSATTVFNWTPPTPLPDGEYTYRAQLLSGTVPVEATTAPRSFNVGLSVSPAAERFGGEGGTGTLQVTATDGLAWTAASDAAWLSVTSGSPGAGDGTVGYTVAPNTGLTLRTGTITINGKTVTVTQDALTLSILDATVTEGNTGTLGAKFTVKLNTPSTKTVTVNYATANGTAVAPGDYQSATGKLTFTPGQTAQVITVPIVGDILDEPNEKFQVNLSAAVNAAVADAQGTGTITDNDPAYSLAVNNVTVTEANTGATSTATFTVKLSQASAQTVTVKYATANVTALAGTDYTALPLTTLTFAPGQTSRTVAVTVKGDLLDEANETFKLVLSSPTNAAIAAGLGTGLCTITDNDLAPKITINDVGVAEPDAGTVALTFTVKLSAPSGQRITVRYATANGTAAATDYTAVPLTTLTFLPGETSKPAVVNVKGDVLKELNETFFVNLSAPVNASLLDAQGIGTILNDD